MLNKSLALPLLEDWVDYLWVAGRERRWVQTLGDGRGQGYARWRALPSPEDWQPVQEGLVRRKTTFKGNTDQPV